jgi:hypothetical protein
MNCKLCLKESKLSDSHIIPEYFYKGIYDDKHKLTSLSTEPKENLKRRSKGLYEKMLCEECENMINIEYENYGINILDGALGSFKYNLSKFTIINNVDYAKFKLFQLSILWRASVARNSFFSLISLGPHEEKIRKMLLEKNPGEKHEYGCIMMWYLVDKKPFLGFIERPFSKTDEFGYRMHALTLGYMFWLFIESNLAEKHRFNELFLEKNGILKIYMAEEEKINMLQNRADILNIAGAFDKLK